MRRVIVSVCKSVNYLVEYPAHLSKIQSKLSILSMSKFISASNIFNFLFIFSIWISWLDFLGTLSIDCVAKLT